MSAVAGVVAGVAPQSTRFMVQWEEHPQHLTSRLGYLLEHQSLVDVTLMCNTHTLKVHRTVLAACSPYFESVLQRQLGNHPLIVLKDMKFCVLKSLIEFMYCGETSVTEENLNPLMEAAKFFEVKGLCTMSKEVLGGERPSPSKTATTINGTASSIADIIPSNSYRGRGRRGVGRGRRNLSNMFMNTPQGVPQAETAQIMLSLSGNTPGATLQTTSRNVPISPNSHMGRTLQAGSNILDTSKLIRNGTLDTTDLKALREQLNLEPRKRGRRRQNFGFGRGRIRELVDTKFGIQSIKKEIEEQHKDAMVLKTVDSKMNMLNNNGNDDAKSPLLASLLSPAELAKSKIKMENESEDNHGGEEEQEGVMYQFDGESSGATKYLDALKEAGLPTDVPVLIDNGDGNYVTLTEDVLMDVLGNNEEFQFQVTEATLEQGDISEGVVLQDGTIMMTGKNIKAENPGPLLTFGRKQIKGVRGPAKRTPKPKQIVMKDVQPPKVNEKKQSPQKNMKKEPESKKSIQELINEAVLQDFKNGTTNEAEMDPDAVVLFEVTDNAKVCKFVVSSKDISALKALNEAMEKQKMKMNSPGEKKSPIPATVLDGNTNIAEIKLTVPKNSRKSIVSEVLARAHSLENQVKNGMLNDGMLNDNMLNDGILSDGMLNDGILNDVSKSKSEEKTSINSPKMLDMNMTSNILHDTSQLLNVPPSRNNLDNPNLIDLGEESQMIEDENSLAVVSEANQILQITGQDESMNIGDNENLIVGNTADEDLQHGVDLLEEPSEDSQLMQINESSQDAGDTEHVAEGLTTGEDDGTMSHSGRDMPLLENESQLVELEFIDGNGQKIEGYRVEGTVLSQKEISELSGLGDQGKDSDVIGLLDMVCEEAAASQDTDISDDVLSEMTKSASSPMDALKASSADSIISQEYKLGEESIISQEYKVSEETKEFVTRTEHLVLEEVQNINTRHLESPEMRLSERQCQDISVEQALQEMMGDENNAAEQIVEDFRRDGSEHDDFQKKQPASENLHDESSVLHEAVDDASLQYHVENKSPLQSADQDGSTSHDLIHHESNIKQEPALQHRVQEEPTLYNKQDVLQDDLQQVSAMHMQDNPSLRSMQDDTALQQISEESEPEPVGQQNAESFQFLYVPQENAIESEKDDAGSRRFEMLSEGAEEMPVLPEPDESTNEGLIISEIPEKNDFNIATSDTDIQMLPDESTSTDLIISEGKHEEKYFDTIQEESELHILPDESTSTDLIISEGKDKEKYFDTIQEESELHILPDESTSTDLIISEGKDKEKYFDTIQEESELHILPDESTNEGFIVSQRTDKQDEPVNASAVEDVIVSPTKDVPFAVGLLPLKDALQQIQSIPEHQPRKTRSASTSKPEVIGVKRRSSAENFMDGSGKRRKSLEGEGNSSPHSQYYNDKANMSNT